MFYSIVIPIYNRPQELEELLESLCQQTFKMFEVIVVEDGSSISSKEVVDRFLNRLDLKYYFQKNSGPGGARNSGSKMAKGDYIIYLDSDTIIPAQYLNEVDSYLKIDKVDAFGGHDAAMESFSEFQHAISYAMTSFFTTGGIRGSKGKKLDKFHPRSFNMGISREVFEVTGGFSDLRYGEDIDLSYRILKSGFRTEYIEKAFVYHKRRNDRKSFFKQVFHSGYARINLSLRHKKTLKFVHTLPALFLVVCTISLFSLTIFPMLLYAGILFFDSLRMYGNINLSLLVVELSFIQIGGYGLGFLNGFFDRVVLRKKEDSNYNIRFFKK